MRVDWRMVQPTRTDSQLVLLRVSASLFDDWHHLGFRRHSRFINDQSRSKVCDSRHGWSQKNLTKCVLNSIHFASFLLLSRIGSCFPPKINRTIRRPISRQFQSYDRFQKTYIKNIIYLLNIVFLHNIITVFLFTSKHVSIYNELWFSARNNVTLYLL